MRRRIVVELVCAGALMLAGLGPIVWFVLLVNGIYHAVRQIAYYPPSSPATVAAGWGDGTMLLGLPLGLIAFGLGLGLCVGALLEWRATRPSTSVRGDPT